MNKPDFAELKEKLIRFDSDDITLNKMIKDENYAWAAYDKMSHIEKVEAHDALLDIANYQHTKSAAIITELLEIISFQNKEVESYARYICCAETCKLSTSWSDNAKCTCGAEKLKNSVKQALSETTARLQKLREGR